MTKHTLLTRLIEQEKLLYLEVEQLRRTLYLHDSSLIFEFFSAFYFAGQDIKKLFVKVKMKQVPVLEVKRKSILSLSNKKKWLLFLSNTPYAWIIYVFRTLKNALLAFRPLKKSPDMALRREKSLSRSARRQSYLIFGTTDSTDSQSRSVQLARATSKKYKVIFVEGVFEEGSRPGHRVVEESNKFTAIRLTAIKSLHLNYQLPSSKEIAFLKQSLRLSTFDFRLSDFELYIHHPFWAQVVSLKKNSFLFDRPDDYSKCLNASPHIVRGEKILLKNARLVTAPHKKLLQNKKGVVVKNGVEWDQFKDTSKMIQTCDVGLCWIKKPVLGYIGTLDEKIDTELLGKLASSFPQASIVLVGNTDYRPSIEVAEQYPNIFPVGKQPYKKLPLFLQSFDILITPFKYSKSTVLIHPELPLYLSSGKPIVCTDLVAASANKGLYYAPKSHTDWVLAVDEALKEKRKSKKRSLRIAAAKKLIWKTPTF